MQDDDGTYAPYVATLVLRTDSGEEPLRPAHLATLIQQNIDLSEQATAPAVHVAYAGEHVHVATELADLERRLALETTQRERAERRLRLLEASLNDARFDIRAVAGTLAAEATILQGTDGTDGNFPSETRRRDLAANELAFQTGKLRRIADDLDPEASKPLARRPGHVDPSATTDHYGELITNGEPPAPDSWPDAFHFLWSGRRIGGHVHVGVWAGTLLQAQNESRPKLGDLVMDPDQWDALKQLVATHTVTIKETDEDGGGP